MPSTASFCSVIRRLRVCVAVLENEMVAIHVKVAVLVSDRRRGHLPYRIDKDQRGLESPGVTLHVKRLGFEQVDRFRCLSRQPSEDAVQFTRPFLHPAEKLVALVKLCDRDIHLRQELVSLGRRLGAPVFTARLTPRAEPHYQLRRDRADAYRHFCARDPPPKANFFGAAPSGGDLVPVLAFPNSVTAPDADCGPAASDCRVDEPLDPARHVRIKLGCAQDSGD